MTVSRPMFPPRAESPDSFPAQPATGQRTSAECTSEAHRPSAELIALGRQLEPLVDAYYAARAVWSPILSERNRELDERFGVPAGYTAEYEAAAKAIDDRVGLHEANERLDALAQQISPIANAILALPVTSIEGLRAKALVAFREVAPLCAGDTEYEFDNPIAFQRLFHAVAQVCGLADKVEATGYVLRWPEVDALDDDEDDGEEA